VRIYVHSQHYHILTLMLQNI